MLEDMTPQKIKELIEAARFILDNKPQNILAEPLFNVKLIWHCAILVKQTPKDMDDAQVLKLILNDENIRIATFNLASKNKPWVWVGCLA